MKNFDLLVKFADKTITDKSINIMSFLTDLIKEKATEVLADKISIPEGIQEQVLGGISDSIFGSIRKQPARKAVSTS